MTYAALLRASALVVVCVLGVAAGVADPPAATGALRPDRAALPAEREAKKPCRTVIRKVKGKRRRVRVCPRRPAPKVQNVALALDASRAASATIGAQGGTVAATAAGGAVLTLAIPPGALDADTKITATPVTSLRRVPAGVRVVGGAQLAPDGLALAKPATLTIDLPAAPRVVTGLAWFEAGVGAHRYPLSRTGRTLRLQVVHFSGAGAFTGPADWLAPIETSLTTRFAGQVRPLMRAAETDENQFQQAMDASYGWEREIELLGHEARFKTWLAEIAAWRPRALANAVEKAFAKCVSHDLTQLRRLMELERFAQASGVVVPGASAFERYVGCARFELDFEYRQTARLSRATASESHTIDTELSVKTTVPIAMTDKLEGQAPLEVTGWRHLETVTSNQSDPPFRCTVTGISAAPERNLHVMLAIDPVVTLGSLFPTIALTVTAGEVTLTRSNGFVPSQPASGSTAVPPPFPGDRGVAGTTLYQVAFSGPFAGFAGGDVYATYGPETVSGTAPGGIEYSMTRRFVLRHVPER